LVMLERASSRNCSCAAYE